MSRFDKTYCSQCGGVFGPGDEGYSHCSDHQRPALTAVQIKGAPIADAMDYGKAVADELPQSQQRWLDAIKEKMALLENNAYAEGRKDEREELSEPWVNVRGCGWHHYTPENIDAIIRDLKLVERGDKPNPWVEGDVRTRCGILWRVISALSHEVPLNPEPVIDSDD